MAKRSYNLVRPGSVITNAIVQLFADGKTIIQPGQARSNLLEFVVDKVAGRNKRVRGRSVDEQAQGQSFVDLRSNVGPGLVATRRGLRGNCHVGTFRLSVAVPAASLATSVQRDRDWASSPAGASQAREPSSAL